MAPTGLGEPLAKRHAGVSVLGCAIAMVAVGAALKALASSLLPLSSAWHATHQ